MEEPKSDGVRLTDQMVLTAFGLAVVYWITDAFVYLFTSVQINLAQRIFGAEWTGLYSRIIVLCFFAIFGSHAQYNINKRRKAEEEVCRLRQQVQALEAGQASGSGSPAA